uniref:NADH-ubiquinone oxidoreductase chain 4L n=1 Tax=Molannodes epaphos TaxID=2904896 RepID=A0A9E8LP27_9NEOP|nr:NADH dehydrogenase subunit 4L [Molannodes epaphos]UZZ44178.1 NADH dehydrogenase subunit 4L [Molannodes epaphos]
MKIFNFTIVIYLYLVGNFLFCLNRKHLLIMLLMLEFIILNLLMMLYLTLSMMLFDYYFMMLFLIICVCEGVLGISILVYMLRIYGNDYFKIYSIF